MRKNVCPYSGKNKLNIDASICKICVIPVFLISLSIWLSLQQQAKQTEEKIKGEFQKLYQFLRAEEATRIDGLRKEAEKKSQAMQIRLINLTAETSSLSKTVIDAETDLKAADLSFMLVIICFNILNLYFYPLV